MGFISLIGFYGFHMGLGDPIWVHMGFIGCARRSRWRANIVRSTSFGLPGLAAAKPAAARAQWLAMSSRAWLLVESKPCKARYLPSLEQWLR